MDAYQKKQQGFHVIKERLTSPARSRGMNLYRSVRTGIEKTSVFHLDLMWPIESMLLSKTLIHHIVEKLFSMEFFLQSTIFLIHAKSIFVNGTGRQSEIVSAILPANKNFFKIWKGMNAGWISPECLLLN